MRTSAIIIFAVFLAVCTNSQPGPAPTLVSGKPASLTSAQATSLAIRLANDKADSIFHHRPFQDGKPARLVTGQWVWTDGCGVALLDYEVRVKLAADGSTNSVKVQLLDNSLHSTFLPMSRMPYRPYSEHAP